MRPGGTQRLTRLRRDHAAATRRGGWDCARAGGEVRRLCGELRNARSPLRGVDPKALIGRIDGGARDAAAQRAEFEALSGETRRLRGQMAVMQDRSRRLEEDRDCGKESVTPSPYSLANDEPLRRPLRGFGWRITLGKAANRSGGPPPFARSPYGIDLATSAIPMLDRPPCVGGMTRSHREPGLFDERYKENYPCCRRRHRPAIIFER